MLGSLFFSVKGKLMRNEKNSHASEIPIFQLFTEREKGLSYGFFILKN